MQRLRIASWVLVGGLSVIGLIIGCERSGPVANAAPAPSNAEPAAAEPATLDWSLDPVVKTEEEWKKILTPEQFAILRKQGTERAGTGKYAFSKDKGTYVCAGCNNPLFSADTKYESGTGWPSFWQPIKKERVKEIEDRAHGMVRTEVVCARCQGHLGHVFDDGPQPTGLRYCMNSAAMKLVKAK